MREFSTGAIRDSDDGKLDYEGFLNPLAVQRFAQFMHKHRKQADGQLRASDNWQKGFPESVYMKSMFRHFMDAWSEHRGIATTDGMEEALCAIIFNANGMLLEILKKKKQ